MQIHLVNISSINIFRETRQRKDISDVSDLVESIKRRGLLQPIIINENDFSLIAGERRLRAYQELGYTQIEARFQGELSDAEAKVIELEENVRRKNLPWKEEVEAYLVIHETFKKENPNCPLSKTAEYIGYSSSYLWRCIEVAKLLRQKDKAIIDAHSLSGACTVIERRQERAIQTEIAQSDMSWEDIKDGPGKNSVPDNVSFGSGGFENTRASRESGSGFSGVDSNSSDTIPSREPNSVDSCVTQGDFLVWAYTYQGRRFNFLHCDFPYGINHHKSGFGGMSKWEEYIDTADLYWQLCRALIENFDRLLFPNANIIFWLSMQYYTETIELFQKELPNLTIHSAPLVWGKTDNRGIVSDPERTPRHTYETALFMSYHDRKVIRPVGDFYGAPTKSSERDHVSEKPEPVLKHFFRLCVDEMSEMLDPTCGSGSALAAAEAVGASRIIGSDINQKNVDNARQRLIQARNYKQMEKLDNV